MIEVIEQLDVETQRQLVVECRDIITASPLYQPRMRGGTSFRLKCASAGECGWHSDEKNGYHYTKVHPCLAQPFPAIPPLIMDIALRSAAAVGMQITPQTALLNWFQAGDSLGLHTDTTERNRSAPIISISLGTDGLFQIGGLDRTDPIQEIILKSGDVLIFGGEHRLIWHGVKKVYPNSLFGQDIGMKQPGRINITVRQYE